MRPRFRLIVLLVLSFMMVDRLAAAQVRGGTITGRISLIDRAGEVLYGDWVRIFLTAEPVTVPTVDLTGIDIPIERQSRINSGHMDFFLNFQNQQGKDGFILDTKLTRPDGTFAFHGIEPGRYWVLVTFPSMIDGRKCAWQAAVDVTGGQVVHVELNAGNLVIPAD